MAWYKVDDKLHSHSKARRAGLPAMGLWSLAGSYCMDYLTDGVVEAWFVESWPDGPDLAARLVDVGLWDVRDGGWVFHDWDVYQPSADKVRETRDARSEAGRKGAANRWNGKPIANAMANEWQSYAPSPSPVPSPSTTKTSKSQSSSNRARVPTDSIEASAMTVRLASQAGLELGAIVHAVAEATGRDIGPEGAYQFGTHILSKAKKYPDGRQTAYVIGAVTRSPFEVQQYIDQNGLT